MPKINSLSNGVVVGEKNKGIPGVSLCASAAPHPHPRSPPLALFRPQLQAPRAAWLRGLENGGDGGDESEGVSSLLQLLSW